MGVTGLWTVVQPCARPIKLETLNKKRLAVDASIWIYQFLKAVRDKEGNALRNSHVVGFFRRICKLLFFGIKPVFVFDGGAPILKRQTVGARKARREGRREDAVRTAGKLLAVQMQRRAEEDEQKRRDERDRPAVDMAEEEIPDNLVYVDELQMSAQERQQKRAFKKQDPYHLPDLPASLSEMGGPDDPRIMSPEELEEYARQFHTGEDINIYDFSKIDFNSQFFISLPATDRYNILNAARLRSRLRMGYSKDQLDTMFPDRMAFSKFQIERVRERNELTQRLMNLNGMNGDDGTFNIDGGGRVAGERGKEYVLVKNDGVEGGWALGVVSNKGEGERNRPIDVEAFGKEAATAATEDDEGEEDAFEDVPIEGLNRLPRRAAQTSKQDTAQRKALSETIDKRRALYQARQQEAGVIDDATEPMDEDPDSLFIPQDPVEGRDSSEQDEIDVLFEDVPLNDADEDEELQKAIAMSLEDPGDELSNETQEPIIEPSYAGPAIDKPLEFNQKNARVGRNFAHQTNARAMGVAPMSREKSAKGNEIAVPTPSQEPSQPLITNASNSSKTVGFDGPLPFESINLGKSVFGRKKKNVVEEGGGFEIEPASTEKKQQDLPPWFSAGVAKEDHEWKDPEKKQPDIAHASSEEANIHNRVRLNRHETGEVIDLDVNKPGVEELIEVISSDDEVDDEVLECPPITVESEIRMGDIADLTRAEPPAPILSALDSPVRQEDQNSEVSPTKSLSRHELDSDEPIEWEESDLEGQGSEDPKLSSILSPAGGKARHVASPNSPSESDFEEVDINPIDQTEVQPTGSSLDQPNFPSLPAADTFDNMHADNEADMYSDPEEEDLMRQMAVEAEEHARFSATLNPQSHLQSAEDYEKELRQLRNQQKKDRRDADEVSQIMVTECQQLLKFFGLPYVTAPMEAEAQCAELVNLGLVDGIVTDDSDVFLFGGTRVYKNMFNQAKFVECYLASDLEKEYSLTRSKLVNIAHLLGSDYTEGLPSVGPVTALEILSEFETLEAFSDWWAHVQLGQPASSVDTASSFRKKFRKNAAKIFLPNGFPDKRVDEAYLHPEVDHDPSPFAWGVPDLDALRSFLMATIGWSQERTDEVLVPVVKDMNRREVEGTQANITQFFGGSVGIGANKPSADGAFAPRRRVEKSKRMTTALGRLHARAKDRTIGEGEEEVEHGESMAINGSSSVPKNHSERPADAVDKSQPVAKRKPRTSKKRPTRDSPLSEGSQDDDEDDYAAPKRPRKNTRGKKSRNEKRLFADSKAIDPNTKPSIHDSDTVVLPGSESKTAVGPTPPAPGAVASVSPATPSSPTPLSDTVDLPQNVPLVPPIPTASKTQTAPPTSIPRSAKSDANPPPPPPSSQIPTPVQSPPSTPPPPPRRKTSRFRRYLFYLFLLTGLSYAGGVYYSLLSDNFHDFFTEYIPYGEDAVFYFEEREFRKRFPSLTNPTNRPAPDSGNKITIPSKSGLSWRLAQEEKGGSDLGSTGRHMSALDKNPEVKKANAQQNPLAATGGERTGAVTKAKEDAKPSPKPQESKPESAPPQKQPEKPVPKAEPAPKPVSKPVETVRDPMKGPEVNEPSVIMPVPRIDPLAINNADEPVVQDLVKMLNDIITVVNADNASYKYTNPLNKAKNELAAVGAKILALKQAEKTSAEQKIKSTQAEFDSSAKELVRRLEIEMRDQELRWKDEFEAERENLSHTYQHRMQTELERLQQVSDQKHRNELLEQAVSLKKEFLSSVRDRVETERAGRLSRLNELSSSVSELERLTADWNSVIDANLQTQHLQVAVEAVRATLDSADRPRPFIHELAALKELAADDPVVKAAIGSINPTAYQRGIPTTAQLIDRFRRVAAEVRKSALLPEDAGIASHAASWALSKVLFRKRGMTTGDDVESVLTRAETLLEEGNLDEAAREMNTLEGWAKTLSWDWLGECRRVLEVRQAMDVIGVEARLRGLSVD